MNRGHRELVGLQVTFSKVVREYHLTHYYRWQDKQLLGPVLLMRGYDMKRSTSISEILEGLLTAYAPAIKSIWILDSTVCKSTFLQFKEGKPPVDLALGGDWKLWAEW